MSLTLRGIAQSAWNAVTYPFVVLKDAAVGTGKIVQDSVKVAAESTQRAAKSVKEATDVVLDYPIDQGAKKAYDATARGVKVAYDETAEAIDTGVKKVKTGVTTAYNETAEVIDTGVKKVKVGVDRTVDAIDDAQEGARRDLADWIAPEEGKPAPAVDGPKPVPDTVKPTPKAPVAMPKTPAETRAFQEKFNTWLASPEGQAARESGVAPLKVDGVIGPLTRYAVAMYNMG
jgi:hypothetical protein